jgi:hypothetical protein
MAPTCLIAMPRTTAHAWAQAALQDSIDEFDREPLRPSSRAHLSSRPRDRLTAARPGRGRAAVPEWMFQWVTPVGLGIGGGPLR